MVISPGHGSPIPTCICVCLGHQARGYIYGDYVVHAPEPVHGRLSGIEHDGTCFLVLHPGETLISRQVIYYSHKLKHKVIPSFSRGVWMFND
uniref:Uncharacterized protein n=1 Tax=Brassica oleracea TaxID=3712 RepID=A0A3P6FP49_BRAOL|nr:unnamed protein product [Brassica oleracea]